jgi:hypothetical protein
MVWGERVVMKWLFLSLVLINAVLFVLNHKSLRANEGEYRITEGAGAIRLLGEELGLVRVSERCLVLSGFVNDKDIDQVRKSLDKAGVRYEQVERADLMASVYWVFVENGQSSEQKKKLKESGIESYEILEGELRGKFSVGLFENIDLARSLVKRLESMAVQADIFERKKTKKTISFEVYMQNAEAKNLLLQGLEASGIKVDQIKEFFCKSIASEK